ncbi:hypothetical protein ACFV1L_26540 [Kitasatospora sp. NPDC059646]|uniref:hypothetical protein n=1 Tax=Kitasatospora sp. NPDC059646 TaxID=3346893 RepID=UPI00367B76EB
MLIAYDPPRPTGGPPIENEDLRMFQQSRPPAIPAPRRPLAGVRLTARPPARTLRPPRSPREW